MAGRVPGHTTQGGTQDRPPDAPPPRRTTSPGPRTGQGRRRLLSPCCRRQPGPVWRTRTHPRIRAQLGNGSHLSRWGVTQDPQTRPSRLVEPPSRAHASPETQHRPTNPRATATPVTRSPEPSLSLIHISEPTRQAEISYAVF